MKGIIRNGLGDPVLYDTETAEEVLSYNGYWNKHPYKSTLFRRNESTNRYFLVLGGEYNPMYKLAFARNLISRDGKPRPADDYDEGLHILPISEAEAESWLKDRWAS